MRTLILLYADKAFPSTSPLRAFQPNPLPVTEETYYGNSIIGDCYITIARRWLEAGHVDQVKAVATQYPEGHPRWSPAGNMKVADRFDFFVLEDLRQYPDIHTPQTDDILFIRGLPPWESILQRHPGSFRLYYNGAATDQWKPRFRVDAILVDDPSRTLPGTRCVEFLKCCDEDVFRPLGLKKDYDVCLIARFDRDDKKGQIGFARKADRNWKTIFVGEPADPGAVRVVRELLPSCEIVEHATKSRVNEILNRSKVSIVNSGATDACPRILVESLAAGTPVVVSRENIGRKYTERGAGEVSRPWTMGWNTRKVLRSPGAYSPRKVYEERFQSGKVAEGLWVSLGIDDKRS